MTLKFTKMHGLGNDFVVIDAINQLFSPTGEILRRLADRHFGVGCDQILVVRASATPGVDFAYFIYNADGTEVEQCGNGARCFAKFVRDQGLTEKTSIVVETNSGQITLQVQSDGNVTVDMGTPSFDPKSIPLDRVDETLRYSVEVNGRDVSFGAVNVGNPHAVILVEDIDAAPVDTVGPVLESHRIFPQRVNVGFMQIVDRNHLRLRVFERGVGETRACGTGACAAVVIARRQGLVDDAVTVSLPGGDLSIQWAGPGSPIKMTGPAASVFEGEIDL